MLKSNILKLNKKKFCIISIALLIIIGSIGYSKWNEYKYKTGYNLTMNEKLININKQLSQNNYIEATNLVDNYFTNEENQQNFYIEQIKLCEYYKVNSFDDLTNDQKVESINKQLFNKDYEKAIELIYDYFTDATICANYFKDIELCKVNNFTSLQDGEDLRHKNEYEIEKKKKGIEKEIKEAQNQLLNIQKKIGEQEEEMAKNQKSGVSIGMTEEQVLNSSWGKPEKINKTTNSNGTTEQWVYGGNNYLYFENGILTTIQN